MDFNTILSIIVFFIGSFFAISILIASALERGGSRVKKVTSMALNADLIKGGYKAYKKITGN
jgi:hypothetical protein